MSKLSEDMAATLDAGTITADDVATVERVTGAAGATPSAYARSATEPPGVAIARVASSGALSARGRAALEAQGPALLDGAEVLSAEAIDEETTEVVITRPARVETWRISHKLNQGI